MKRKTFTLNLNLLSRLLLTFALIIGGGNIWAYDAKITFTSNDAPSGWTLTNSQYVSDMGIYPNKTWNTLSFVTSSPLSLSSGQKIRIKAKAGILNSNLVFKVYTSETTTFSSTVAEFGYKYFNSLNNSIELIVDNLGEGTRYIKIEDKYVYIESIEFVESYDLTLDENNETALNTKGTFPKTIRFKYTPQSGWNTMCVPIQMKSYSEDALPIIFGSDYKAYKINSYSDNTLTFSSATTVSYNTPVLVYTESPNSMPVGGFSISVPSSGYISYSNVRSVTADDATFQGTFATKTYNAETDVVTPWYGVTPSGQIMKAASGAHVKGYRGYFTGVSAPSGGGSVRMLIIEDEGTTDLGIVKMVDAEAKDVYTLTGQKVQKGRKGIYIVNGKKVVIK